MLSTKGPWVTIVVLDGDDYREAERQIGEEITSRPAKEVLDLLAEHLYQWEFGEESEHLMSVREDEPWGSSDTTHEVKIGALDYVISINVGLQYVALQRRVLNII